MKRVVVVMCLAAFPALAGPRDDVYSASARCAGIAEDRAWLDCYYGAAQPMRSRLGLTPAPASQTQLVPASAPQRAIATSSAAPSPAPPPLRDDGSAFGHLFGGKPLVSNVRMANYSFDRDGVFTVSLEDGEVWEQSRNPNNFAKWKLPASSYYVSVLPGVMGSYDLKVRGLNGYFKVHRLR
jgi:hypothetical protein